MFRCIRSSAFRSGFPVRQQKKVFSAQTFLNGSTSNYVDAQYEAWQIDNSSVHPSWAAYFSTGDFETAPPTKGGPPQSPMARAPPASSESAIQLVQMVRSFQIRGHFGASLDPLGIFQLKEKYHKAGNFELKNFRFTENDLNTAINLGSSSLLSGFLGAGETKNMTVGEIYARLKETYCGNIGYQYMHLHSREETSWIQNRIETPIKHEFSKKERLIILDRLTWAHHFENFLGLKWTAQKRFGLDGLESLIPGMKTVIDVEAELGVSDVVLGMPHRGRLSVLATTMRKDLDKIFYDFHGPPAQSDDVLHGSGDVKYHLGSSTDRGTHTGNMIHMSLVANPSHLEAANTVVCGKTRAKLDYSGDKTGETCLAFLIHGDAAFSGQGIVYETLVMTDLPDYTTGGVIHIVCNNQVGFTTDPQYARSAPYCTDVAKGVGAPIFHVNADDAEAVVRVCRLAMEFRQTFKKDVVIDLVGYRQYGHNEGDEPRFTQPYMYSKIDKHPDSLTIYKDKLISEGFCTTEELQAVSDRVMSILREGFEASKTYSVKESDWLDANWEGFLSAGETSLIQETGVSEDILKKVGKALTDLPEGFTIHSRLKKIFEERTKMGETGKGIDWGTAEGMAFGTLLLEGCHVRLSGQDVQRGTFSHRHSVVHDQLRHNPTPSHTPLHHLEDSQAKFCVSNSPLSEYGVLGYEYGYSLESPQSLVLWEAQFGDFANGAQIMFDQFISSGESKWRRQSGLVVLLPHGYEGAGPEHSSGRLERFLQMCDDRPDEFPEDSSRAIQNSNWQIVNCSTPANYFHVLRRQIHRDFRKPLIIFTPKSLLKLRDCVSSYEEMNEGTKFLSVIPERHDDQLVSPDKIQRLVLCSGKVYYDLIKERKARKVDDVAIVTIEQLSPFPFEKIRDQASVKYPNAEVVWVQEEPMNMGAWSYVQPRIVTTLKDTRGIEPRYAGRDPSASPATGFGMATHKAQLAELLEDVFK